MMRNITVPEEMAIAAGQLVKEKKYWLNKLSGELLKSGFPCSPGITGGKKTGTATVKLKLSQTISSELLRLSKGSDPRIFMILTTSLVILLGKYTGNNDIILGAPIYKQDVDAEFINTVLTLRNRLTDNMTFKELLIQARETIVEAVKNQNYPIEALIHDLNMTFSKDEFQLFDVAILLENIHEKQYLNHIYPNMIFSFLRSGDVIEGELQYNESMYDRAAVERIGKHYVSILGHAILNVDGRVDDIEMLLEEEKRVLLHDFNDTGSVSLPKEACIHQLFEDQVQKTPRDIAVVFNGQHLNYGDLDRKANSLARLLKQKNVSPGSIVGIMLERSMEMIIAMIGILKSGGAYLALDPEYPVERIKFMIRDSGVNLVLTKGPVEMESPFAGEIIDLEEPGIYLSGASNLQSPVGAHDMAYVVYTSGSTGAPKGVAVAHASIANTLLWRKIYYQFDKDQAVMQIPSFSFDSSVEDIFVPLISGSQLVMIQEQFRMDPPYLKEIIENNKITHFLITPGFYKTLLTEIPGTLKKLQTITLAGDHFTGELVKEHFEKLDGVRLFNEYGPSENSVCSTVYEFSPEQSDVLVGKPIPGVHCYILNHQRKLSPFGVPGELYLSGKGLAKGYLNRPELTHQKFITDPNFPGERMYLTGDMARWHTGGNLEFLDRIDQQVKIRGFRVEIGEIENRLLSHGNVKEAAVAAREDQEGNKYLCAYLVTAGELDVTSIAEYLLQTLPGYMVPTHFVELERIPLTATGKIDRKQLQEMSYGIKSASDYVPPRNSLEEKLVEIWKDKLQLDKIGIKDNYFHMGGDSIKSIGLLTAINEGLGKNLKVADLYVNNTIELLANKIVEDSGEPDNTQNEYNEALQEIESLQQSILMGD
jgi:tyrocidine synthetase III